MALKRKGYECDMAVDGLEAVHAVMKHPDLYTAIFMDNIMPVMVRLTLAYFAVFVSVVLRFVVLHCVVLCCIAFVLLIYLFYSLIVCLLELKVIFSVFLYSFYVYLYFYVYFYVFLYLYVFYVYFLFILYLLSVSFLCIYILMCIMYVLMYFTYIS